jgi:hypothetical protein
MMIYLLIYVYLCGAFLFASAEHEPEATLSKKTLHIAAWPFMVTLWVTQVSLEAITAFLSENFRR